MDIAIIAALSENRIIGRSGELPWRLPDDLKRFKQRTMGHHLILGRKTFESLPGPLPGREIIVVTRNQDYVAVGCRVVHGLQAALNLAAAAGDPEVFIGGGAQIYALALPLAGRMYLTRVHAILEGDATFPPFEEGQWTESYSEYHPVDARHPYAFTFTILERITNSILKSS